MTKIAHIDAGHGGTDSGAIGNGLYEKTIVLGLAKRVGEILTNDYDGVAVNFTRTTDKFIGLSERADMAGREGADFFLSIHVNAGGGTGYEDYIYSGCATDGDTDKLRDKLHEAVLPVLKKYGIENRGKKKANYAVLRESSMPAVLVETLFIDTDSDAKHLKDSAFLEDMAQAYAQGVAAILGASRKVKTVEATGTKELYHVQVGAFAIKENAEQLETELKNAGFSAFIKKE